MSKRKPKRNAYRLDPGTERHWDDLSERIHKAVAYLRSAGLGPHTIHVADVLEMGALMIDVRHGTNAEADEVLTRHCRERMFVIEEDPVLTAYLRSKNPEWARKIGL